MRRRRPRLRAVPTGPAPTDAEIRERRVRLAARAILVVGLGAALVAFVVARVRPENPLGYDPLETKRYLHDLQLYGGTANVLAAQFREWFAGLWYGKNLAYTLAVLTLVLARVVRFFGVALPPEPEPETEEEAAGPLGPRPAPRQTAGEKEE